jgi:hypothetical protein
MFRRILVLAVALPLTAAAAPKATSPLVADVIACRAVAAAEARLGCFEAAAERLDAASRGGGIVVIDQAAAEAARRDTFGLGLPRLAFLDGATEGKPLETLEGVLKSARVLPGEGFGRFELEDGSVWRQISGVSQPGAKPGARVRITRGAVGSYWLKIGDQPSVKAHRDL